MADKIAPLYDLLKGSNAKNKYGKIRFQKIHYEAWDKIKTILASDLKLSLPKPGIPIFLATDASTCGLGGILFQPSGKYIKGKDQKINILSYHSKILSKSQQNYKVHELEALSIISALLTCSTVLSGQKIYILTDNLAMKYLSSPLAQAKVGQSRLQRYLYVLNSFDVEVIYLKGSSNHIPDFLSRYGVEKGDSLVSEQEIDKFIDNRLLPITQRINTNRGCSPQKLLKNELQNCRRVNTLKPNQAWALLNDDSPSTIKRLLFKSSNKSPEIEPSWKFDIPEFEHSEQSSQNLNERELIKSDIECDNISRYIIKP